MDMGLSGPAAAAARADDYVFYDHAYVEKRQLFLRSYQFSREKTASQRFRGSLLLFFRTLRSRFRAARMIRRLVWSRLRKHSCCGLLRRRRRRVFDHLSSEYSSSSAAARDWFGTPCH